MKQKKRYWQKDNVWYEALRCWSKNTACRWCDCLAGKKKTSSQPSVSTALCSLNLCHRAFTLCYGPACCWKIAFFSVSTNNKVCVMPWSAMHQCQSSWWILRGLVCRDQFGTGFYIHCSLILIIEILDPAVWRLCSSIHFIHSLTTLF